MQAWEPHAAVRMPAKSRSEKSGTWADTPSSDSGLLVVGCPFLSLKDPRASDFCLQPPEAFARWESLPTPFIVTDEGSMGCSQQGDVKAKNTGARRHSEGAGGGSGVGMRQARDHRTVRKSRVGRAGGR